MCAEIIYQLAVQSIKVWGNHRYGHTRKRITNNGYSEIMLFTAAANHVKENGIDPVDYGTDMMALLEGCSRTPHFTNIDDNFSYLRGKIHSLKHGNLDKDEPKSPEQKGKFLCANCFTIQPNKERRAPKDFSCKSCNRKSQAAAYQKKQAAKIKKSKAKLEEREDALSALSADDKAKLLTQIGQVNQDELLAKMKEVAENTKAQQPEPEVEEPVFTQPSPEEQNASPQFIASSAIDTQPYYEPILSQEDLDALTDEPDITPFEPEPVLERTATVRTEAPQPIELKPLHPPIAPATKALNLQEIMSDANEATVTLTCTPAVLHVLLTAIDNAKAEIATNYAQM